jgi:glycosyltransferase involved in cell wall biosynthesis
MVNKIHRQKIFVDATSLTGKVSGVGHNTLELVKGMAEDLRNNDKFEIVLLIPFDKVKDLEKNGAGGIPYKLIPIPLIAYSILWKLKLLPPLDIVFGKGIYIFPNFRNTPLIFSKNITFIHDVSFLRYPEFTEPRNLIFLKNNIRNWAKRSDVVATLSESSKKDLQEYLQVPKDKIEIISCGIDAKVFYHRPESQIINIKQKYNIDGDYLLYVGNIEPRKNLMKLLEAYEIVTKTLPSLKLLIIGSDGWLNEAVISKIAELQHEGLGVMRPAVYVPDEDLPAIYSGALMLVHPAIYEGFGIPPLEAMACGIPVIVGNNSSLPEVVGSAGTYVDIQSAKDISHAITNLIENKKARDELIKKGYVQSAKFSWLKSANKLIAIAESLSKNK